MEGSGARRGANLSAQRQYTCEGKHLKDRPKKEKAMTQQLIATQTQMGYFDTIAAADRAIRRLLAAGFSKDQLAVVCPAKFKDHFLPDAPLAEVPAADAPGVIAVGSAMGATLGGLALAATVLTGGAAGAVAAAVFVGGGVLAGGFGNLIVSKGYEQEADDHYKRAIQRGQIVVGVELQGEDHAGQLAEAQRNLDEAGATALESA
jgi:hypothetical protein